MSSRTAERAKAVRKAWEREQQLVSSGEGTRDWTIEQQQSILDLGVALDDEGKPFEGQHMKSVAAYPEYAGDPKNIQFLTRQEHLEAHDGSWQNQTNWYYDPVTKQKTLFGDELIPCKVIQLSEPIMVPSQGVINEVKQSEPIQGKPDEAKIDPEVKSSINNTPVSENLHSDTGKAHAVQSHIPTKMHQSEGRFVKALKSVGRFIVEHPVETLEIVGVVATGIAKVVVSSSRSHSANNSSYRATTDSNQSQSSKSNIATAVADIIEKANRSSPREHEVPGHGQHYHTKDGVIWKEKGPYHRGGNKE